MEFQKLSNWILTYFSSSNKVDDLDGDFYDELDDVQVNRALGCTFLMDQDHDHVGIIQVVNLIQTLN